MTSKKQLRAEIERLRYVNLREWEEGLKIGQGDVKPWLAHLARVTTAAREEGRREGWAEGYNEGWDAGFDALPTDGCQGDPDDQPETDSTPVDEFADLAFPPLPRGLDSPTPGYHPCTCGFACCCATIPSAWTPGSVTR